MSKKQQIEDALDSGKEYNEIEQETGATRGYIRSIASHYAKRAKETDMEHKEPELPETHPKEDKTVNEESNTLTFDHDEPETDKDDGYRKYGKAYHDRWVKEAKYECGECGCTLNRKSTFCPHCGAKLNWSGF